MTDVMGSRPMNERQMKQVESLRAQFEQLHAAIKPPNDAHPQTPESSRLFAMARSDLEKACLLAVKAVSRMAD